MVISLILCGAGINEKSVSARLIGVISETMTLLHEVYTLADSMACTPEEIL